MVPEKVLGGRELRAEGCIFVGAGLGCCTNAPSQPQHYK